MANDLLVQIEASNVKVAAISFKKVERFCGLPGYICQLMPDGNALRNSIASLLKPQHAATEDTRLVSKEGTAVDDIKITLNRCARNEFLPPLRSPAVVYGGRLGLAAEACMNSNRASGGGWGSLSGRYFSMGDCPQATKVVIEGR